ncbi:hypothetical protein DPMN_018889 [Dreissena polymorpha]|uniref:Uncharacterized protein n=1 Tax=Dreissena polymorpha TaxID=45954 RepID=A0A9D4NK52_DREPO|nr:hypothetical protein DPMN_018889 [Dreissena polymorpha]
MSVGRSVGPSTRWLSDDNSRKLGPRIMKLHRYIDHDSQMTPIDFQVTRSNVKVTVALDGMCIHIPGFLTTARGFDRFVLHVFLRITAMATLSNG